MFVLLLLLISSLINRSGLRISHSKVFSSGEHGYQCLIAIQQNMDINAWSRFSRTWISMLDRDSAEHGYQCLIAIQQSMDINAWTRFKAQFWLQSCKLVSDTRLSSDQLISISIREVMIYLISVNPPECTLYSYHAVYWSRYQFEK